MKNFQDSDYALNKYSFSIVYRFVDEIMEVTLSDYLAENPGTTEADYRKWKEFSDLDYRERDRAENRQAWKNVPFGALAKTLLCSVPSAETVVIDKMEEAERSKNRTALGRAVWDKLTAIQRRRYYLYYVEGLSTWKIAEVESVNQSKICKSLSQANKKIEKHLSEQ